MRGNYIKILRSKGGPFFGEEGLVWDKVSGRWVDGTPFCFVERETGNIYKAGCWRFPAKKYIRGNIFDPDQGLSKMTPDGPAFLQSGCPKGFIHKPRNKEGSDYTEVAPLISIPPPSALLPIRIYETASTADFFGVED
jgi:hypothetical protein